MSHPEDCSYDTDALAEAHVHTLHNRAEIVQSQNVRCICCLATMPADTVTDYIDGGPTALCPACGTDTLIGDAAPFPLDDKLFRQLHRHYF